MSSRFTPKTTLALLFFLQSLPGTAQQGDSISEEEKRRRFLKAREEMQTSPAPAPQPTSPATANPASSPKPKPKASPVQAPPQKKISPPEPPPKPAAPQPAPVKSPPPKVSNPAPPPPTVSAPKTAPIAPPVAIPAPAKTVGKDEPAPFIPDPDAPVVIEKSGVELKVEQLKAPSFWERVFGRRRSSSGNYKYLTQSVRNEIDRAKVASGRWKYIVVHNSGTRQGNAKAFDYYHTHVRKMSNGLAYHFVIGNGTSSGNGQIEIGPRWSKQMSGGHVHSDYLNSIGIGICLVGDYNQDRPRQEQLDALDELIRYLRERVGKSDGKWAIVKAHREINPPRWPTDCPGNDFPYRWLHSRYD